MCVTQSEGKHRFKPSRGMGREFFTASIFCLLCATHAHCSSHHDIKNSHLSGIKASYNDGGGGKSQNIPNARAEREIRNGDPTINVDYIGLVFEKYGDGKLMTRSNFGELLDSLGLAITVKTSQNKAVDDSSKQEKNTSNLCVSVMSSVKESGVTKSLYRELCPRIIYQLVPGIENGCFEENHRREHAHHHDHEDDDSEQTNIVAAWVYATISVLLISLCGLLAVAVIPLMQMSIYQGLLQFLVALAVGTLCGDALLHLLPHAMMASHSHGHSHNEEHEDQHHVNLLRGLVAALSVVFFYFIEKCLSIMTDWHKKTKRKTNVNTRVRVMREEHGNQEESRVGEKLCKHKYSSYPYCYGEIANNPDAHQVSGDSEINNAAKVKEENGSKSVEGEEIQKDEGPNSEKQLLEINGDTPNDYTTVILREHETRHHGHAHTHGHVHSAPESLSSVAWMVIMGDGIHNLTDGLAIGAAFAANIGGGVSTAVAVFCHELPHEIGDFAVLLKAGMSAKQAVFYNMLSSLLCLMGMSIGVMLGHNDNIKLWVFSAAAGMFLYIALVDMIPELTSSHTKEGGSVCQCLLQLFGLLAGVGIMLLIAVYEHDLMNSFKNKF